MKKRLLSLLLAASMVLSLCPASAFAEDTGGGTAPDAVTPRTVEEQNDEAVTYTVKTAEEFQNAVAEINAAESGAFTIKLGDDISLSGDTELTKNTTTILGEGHILNGGNNCTLKAAGSAVLNLGQAGYTEELIFDGKGDVGTVIGVTDQATLNMYDGVTIKDHTVNGSDAAVSIGSKAAFNMNGGTIKNCKDAAGGTTGGVGVGTGTGAISADISSECTFTMNGGSIIGCEGGRGGGVRVGDGSTFIMNDGIISGCTAKNGGAVYAEKGNVTIAGGEISGNTATENGGGLAIEYMKYSRLSWFPRNFIVRGGEISGNTATGNGGGIYMVNSNTRQTITGCTITANSAQLGGGVYLENNSDMDISGAGNALYNNTAGTGADVYLKAESPNNTIMLPDAAGMDKKFGTSRNKIDGWYNDDPHYEPSEDAEAVDVSSKLSGQLALVASFHGTLEPDIPDDPSTDGSLDSGAGAVVAGTLLGGTAYLLGTHLWLEGTIGFVPVNREQLAVALWNQAGSPEPQSAVPYTDIADDDTDGQQAARWCAEQGLMKDYGESFKPGSYVFRPQSIRAWSRLQRQLKAQH